MKDFVFYNPVRIVFGAGSSKKAGVLVSNYAKRVLVVTGKGSIKRSGRLEEIERQLSENGIAYKVIKGVKPNPVIEKVYEGIEEARKFDADGVLAAGGGSVIDTAKAIAVGKDYKGDVWDFYSMKNAPSSGIPIIVLLTVAATGSEMNSISVIQNNALKHKIRAASEYMFPKVSILDPELTMTLPMKYTAYASVDIISHVIEGYFTSEDEDTPIENGFVHTIVKTVIENTYRIIKDNNDIGARANLMWASTLALNGITTAGIGRFSFENHLIEHALSAYHDIAHGAGLSIVIPAWMKENLRLREKKFASFAEGVFGVNAGTSKEKAGKCIELLEGFFKEIGAPVRLTEAGIDKYDEMIDSIVETAPTRNLVVEREYIERIFEKAE